MEYGSRFCEGIRVKVNLEAEVVLSPEELRQGGKEVYGLIDERIEEALSAGGKKVFQEVSKEIQEKLLEGTVGKHQQREITFQLRSCGEVKVRCWQIKEVEKEKKRYRVVLKDYLGLVGREKMSPVLEKDLVLGGATQTYRKAAKREGVSHTTVWKKVQKYGKGFKELEEAVLSECVEGEKEVGFLGVEPDGIWVRRQRGPRKSMEIKGLLTFEGRGPRYGESKIGGGMKLVGKRIFAGISGAEDFVDQATRSIAHRYRALEKTKLLVISDGAAWIKEIKDYYPTSFHQLDRFHLEQAITRGTACSKALRKGVRQALFNRADVEKALQLLEEEGKRFSRCEDRIMKEKGMEKLTARMKRYREQSRELSTYLRNHREILFTVEQAKGFAGENAILGSGGIERNLETIFGHRMKGDGKSWTLQGAEHMVKVRCSIANGTFDRDGYLIANRSPQWVEPEAPPASLPMVKKISAIDGGYYSAFQGSIPRNTATPMGKLLEQIAQGTIDEALF